MVSQHGYILARLVAAFANIALQQAIDGDQQRAGIGEFKTVFIFLHVFYLLHKQHVKIFYCVAIASVALLRRNRSRVPKGAAGSSLIEDRALVF